MGQTPVTWRQSSDDLDPILIRDPIAEVLGVLPDGEPFEISYVDVVRIAGHSCPAAAGAFRITETGLAALYPDDRPVRSRVAVQAGGTRDDHPTGVIARLVSYVTGAAGPDGFGGLGKGFGGRADLLTYDDRPGEGVRFAFQRTDTDEAVEVVYHLDDVPSLGPAAGHLPDVIDGTATRDERDEFERAWHARVDAVLTDDDLFAVGPTDPFVD